MADKWTDTRTSTGRLVATKGPEVGKDSKYKVDKDKEDWEKFKTEKRKPFYAQQKDYQKEFDEWRKPKPTPAPKKLEAPTSDPIQKTGM